jgi:hypothetical protein
MAGCGKASSVSEAGFKGAAAAAEDFPNVDEGKARDDDSASLFVRPDRAAGLATASAKE